MIARQLSSLLRSAVLAFALMQVLGEFWILYIRRSGVVSVSDRACWLHSSCAMILRRLDMRVCVEGPLPERGLLVSNHLSYLDILFYAATMPCVFVAKSEVRSWPCFGLLSRCAGTVFIDRSRPTSASRAADEMKLLLDSNVTVLLFPEGTSSDGSAVLRFHPSLFEPAVIAGVPVTAASIAYSSDNAAPERVLCYFGDDTLGPHLFRTLGAGELTGYIDFASEARRYANRKTAASETWLEVTQFRNARLETQSQTATDATVGSRVNSDRG